MNTQTSLIAYGSALVAFLVLDFTWLSTVGSVYYKPALAYHMAESVRFGAALCFYLLYVTAVVFFAIRPAFQEQSGLTALLYGGFFGLVAYATYDLSNLATLKQFPTEIALLDMAWGTVLTAASTYAGFRAASAWG